MATQTCRYEIDLETGSRQNAGTKAKVMLKLCDFNGTCPVNVDDLKKYGTRGSNYNYFQQSNTDRFAIEVNDPCVETCKMILSHDNNGDDPSWYVEVVQVRALEPEGEYFSEDFEVHRWLSTTKPPRTVKVVKDRCGGEVMVDATNSLLASVLLKRYGIA